MTLDQCVKELVFASQSGEGYSESRVRALVDGYLAGFVPAIASRRDELARALMDAAPVSETSDRIVKSILNSATRRVWRRP
jgi:hypothetical protein